MYDQGMPEPVVENPLHMPLKALERKGWSIDYKALSAQVKFAPFFDSVHITNFSALCPDEDTFTVSFHVYFDEPFPDIARPFLGHLTRVMEEKGSMFSWGEHMFNVRWNIVEPELFELGQAAKLSRKLDEQLETGGLFALSCAQVLILWFGGVSHTRFMTHKWVSFDHLVDFCLHESMGSQSLLH